MAILIRLNDFDYDSNTVYQHDGVNINIFE